MRLFAAAIALARAASATVYVQAQGSSVRSNPTSDADELVSLHESPTADAALFNPCPAYVTGNRLVSGCSAFDRLQQRWLE
jgi:hypothetical protein